MSDSSRYLNNQTQSVEMSSFEEMDPYDTENPSHFSPTDSNELLAPLNALASSRYENRNRRCIWCNRSNASYCCPECSKMTRSRRFRRLLEILEQCSDSLMYHDEITFVVKAIQQVNLLRER